MKYTYKECQSYTSRVVKSVNDKLQHELFGCQLMLAIDYVDHFADRIYDRNVQFEHVVELFNSLIKDHLCDLLYAISLPENYKRIDFQSGDIYVGASVNPQRNKLTLRTVMPGIRSRGIQKKYIINMIGDNQ